MKIEKRGVFALILLLIFQAGTGIIAQETTILDHFTVNKTDGNVYLNWVISSGSTCDGTKIYRSNDQVNFDQIGEILGVCGNTTFPTGYKFVDENPEQNQRNYYRLELGRTGFSEIVSLEVINLENGYQVRPNPVTTHAKIYFENEKREMHELRLYDINGAVVDSGSTDGVYFDINAIDLQPGIHVFTIVRDGSSTITKGKLLKQR